MKQAASEKATEVKKGVQGAATDIKEAAERGKAKAELKSSNIWFLEW